MLRTVILFNYRTSRHKRNMIFKKTVDNFLISKDIFTIIET